MDKIREERSLGELFSDLSRETSTLVRHEVDLARTEITQKASKVGKDVGTLAVGGAIAYAGFLAILAAVIIILASFIPWWLSALIVGLVVAVIGYFLVQKGLNDLKRQDMAHKQTIETVKEDTEWAKQQMR
jgi:xanthine/uracil permease